jgi:hypothetical protein
MAGGTFTVASYDKLKELKRGKTLWVEDWEGTEYPVVGMVRLYVATLK